MPPGDQQLLFQRPKQTAWEPVLHANYIRVLRVASKYPGRRFYLDDLGPRVEPVPAPGAWHGLPGPAEATRLWTGRVANRTAWDTLAERVDGDDLPEALRTERHVGQGSYFPALFACRASESTSIGEQWQITIMDALPWRLFRSHPWPPLPERMDVDGRVLPSAQALRALEGARALRAGPFAALAPLLLWARRVFPYPGQTLPDSMQSAAWLRATFPADPGLLQAGADYLQETYAGTVESSARSAVSDLERYAKWLEGKPIRPRAGHAHKAPG